MKKITLVVGFQGSGKDSIVDKICKRYDLTKVVSYTTRKRRENEKDTHIFITPEESQKMNYDKVTYTKIGDIEYFATLDQIKKNDIYIIDPIGVYNLKKNLKGEFKIVTFYIHVPKSVRLERVLKRNEGDTIESFEKRYYNEKDQFHDFIENKKYDYCILNNNFEEAVFDMAYYMFLPD